MCRASEEPRIKVLKNIHAFLLPKPCTLFFLQIKIVNTEFFELSQVKKARLGSITKVPNWESYTSSRINVIGLDRNDSKNASLVTLWSSEWKLRFLISKFKFLSAKFKLHNGSKVFMRKFFSFHSLDHNMTTMMQY